jgi:hypothetical protein
MSPTQTKAQSSAWLLIPLVLSVAIGVIELTWDYALPLPSPNIQFEFWSATNVSGPFTLWAVTNQPPLIFTPTQHQQFFIMRAVSPCGTSDWNTK